MPVIRGILSSRTRLCLAAAAIAALASSVAYAYFATTAASGSNGGALSASLPQGNTPTVTLSGPNVRVSWAQNTVVGHLLGTYTGGAYTVKRYPASGGSAVTPGAGCDTTITGSAATLSCTEDNVPPGAWKYTVTPILNNWTGAESAESATVSIASISVSPSSGQVGDTVTLSGSNFPASSAITATYDGSALTLSGTTTTDASGAIPFGVTFTVPASSAGGHTVKVTAGGQSATATFSVQPQVTLSPTSGVAGTTGTITGSGFAASSTVTATFGGASVTLTGGSTNTSGSFTATYTVPNQAPGAKTVVATDGSSNAASASYTINTPSTSLSPSTGNVAATVTLSGSNFPANSAITATYAGTAVTLSGATTTTANGAIPSGVTFTVPASTGGAHTVQVTAGTRSASATFTVQPQITLSPTSGTAGSSDSISGTGFAANSTITATFNGSSVTLSGTTTTDSNGSFTAATYTVPATATGSYNIVVTDGSSNNATATYSITSRLTITYTENPSDHNYNFFGTGAVNGSTITVTVCSIDQFPCPASPTNDVVGTASTNSLDTSYTNGAWPEGSDTAQVHVGNSAQTYWAQATQGSATSAPFQFTSTASNGGTEPFATGVTLVNANGNTPGQAAAGDSLVVTYSEPIDATTICPSPMGAWVNNGTPQSSGASVTITHGATSDTIGPPSGVSGGTCSAFNFGIVTLGNRYTQSGNVTFPQSTVSWNPSTDTLTITLGGIHTGDTLLTGVPSAPNSYAPSTSLTDQGRNPVSAASVTGTSSQF